MICLGGGPSHVDTYQMTPGPVEIRGEFRPIKSNVPGMDLCELLPRQAKIADKFAVVRSATWLIGYTGMVSFGHSAFFGLGMYGAAARHSHRSSHPTSGSLILYGPSASAAVALFMAYFSTRLRDIYFAITTLIFSQIFYVIIFTWTEVTGGENGLSFTSSCVRHSRRVDRASSHPPRLHWFVLAFVTASYLILRRITQSPFGMVLQSIRENEARTRAIGYPVQRYKIVAVMLSGLFAGLAGVLYAVQNRFAAPDFVYLRRFPARW